MVPWNISNGEVVEGSSITWFCSLELFIWPIEALVIYSCRRSTAERSAGCPLQAADATIIGQVDAQVITSSLCCSLCSVVDVERWPAVVVVHLTFTVLYYDYKWSGGHSRDLSSRPHWLVTRRTPLSSDDLIYHNTSCGRTWLRLLEHDNKLYMVCLYMQIYWVCIPQTARFKT